MRSPPIPGVGKRTAAVMEQLGIRPDLRDPEELYLQECLMKGYQEDRCTCGGRRCTAPGRNHPEKLKWWAWKDERSEKG